MNRFILSLAGLSMIPCGDLGKHSERSSKSRCKRPALPIGTSPRSELPTSGRQLWFPILKTGKPYHNAIASTIPRVTWRRLEPDYFLQLRHSGARVFARTRNPELVAGFRVRPCGPSRDDVSIYIDAYEHTVRLWTVVLEISVMMAQFPSRAIAELSYEFRTLGLGFANIGGLLMTMGLSYDFKEGRALCGALTAIMTGMSYATSAEMAKELGPFPGYKKNAGHMLRVIRNHRRAAHGESRGYEALAVNPVPLDAASVPQTDIVTHARPPGTRRSNSANCTAIATRRPRWWRRPAPSALSWIATPPASSRILRW